MSRTRVSLMHRGSELANIDTYMCIPSRLVVSLHFHFQLIMHLSALLFTMLPDEDQAQPATLEELKDTLSLRVIAISETGKLATAVWTGLRVTQGGGVWCPS